MSILRRLLVALGVIRPPAPTFSGLVQMALQRHKAEIIARTLAHNALAQQLAAQRGRGGPR